MNKEPQKLRIGVLGCGPVSQAAHRAIEAGKHVLVEKPLGVSVEECVEFADGSVGHLDLTVAVHMDWHEGFQVYGEYGSVIGKTYNPWYLRASDVECFSVRNDQYHRILGQDAHFYKLQIEGFADTILHRTPMRGADVEDGTAAIRALVAIYHSVKTGKWVQVADMVGGV